MGPLESYRVGLQAALIVATLLPGGGAAQSVADSGDRPARASPRVFAPLLADEREVRSFVKISSGGSPFQDTRIFSMALGDSWRMVGLGADPGSGYLEIDFAGGVFAQFDLDSRTFDLLNADFVVGLPITLRRGRVSGRLRIFHQSSHLGDDYLARVPTERQGAFDFESVELLTSVDAGPFRVYGGGENRWRRSPEELLPLVLHLGAEARHGGSLGRPFGFGEARLVGAVHMTAQQAYEWSPAWSLRGGVEIAAHRSDPAGHRYALMVEFFDGPSPYGQFHEDTVHFVGIGLQVLH